MLKHLPRPVRGLLSLTGYLFNTLFWSFPLLLFTFLKMIVPIPAWRRFCGNILNRAAKNWIAVNRWNQRLVARTRMDVQGVDELRAGSWYLVLANHQSWVDILVLQHIFHGKIPFLKFFIKKELFWVPILGQCWWALDFPFMKRYSKSFLKKHPHLKGKDIETTRKACEKFKTTPVSIMNFVEGTRFSGQKKELQNSPFKNLLKTRAGGMAYVLGAMSDQLEYILDVTIVYPQGIKSFWDYACGGIDEIKIRVKSIPVTPDLVGDYVSDKVYRTHIHQWLNSLWQEKDRLIDELQSPDRILQPDLVPFSDSLAFPQGEQT